MVDEKSRYVNRVADALFDTMLRHASSTGSVPPMTFILYENGLPWQTVVMPSNLAFVLNSGPAKDHLFGWWRTQCQKPSVDALAIGSEAWMFDQNEKAEELMHTDPEGFQKLLDHGFNHLLALGLGTRHAAFMVTAQTRDLVVIAQRRFERKDGQIVWTAPAERDEFPQANFGGRQKMWGDLSPENLR